MADTEMPRTVFYERLCDAIRLQPGFTWDEAAAALLFPAEDTSNETNWPRFGRPETAFLRGQSDESRTRAYLARLRGSARALCVVNMHPFIRVPTMMSAAETIIVADVNLLMWERAFNPRTISMPAPPITKGSFDSTAKTVLASFRGAESHPCRRALASIANRKTIRVELVSRADHIGQIDAEARVADPAYSDLLNASVFAFVPRGEAEFSYRLLEVMSFGCIPVVIADGLVLPFDRTIDWHSLAVQVPESRVTEIPAILAGFSSQRIATMQIAVLSAYSRCLDGFGSISATLIAEAATIMAQDRRAPGGART